MKKLVPYLVVVLAKEENRKMHTKRSLIERPLSSESRQGLRMDKIDALFSSKEQNKN